MNKLKIKKIYESKKNIEGMLSNLANMRNAIFYQNNERTESLINIFDYEFNEIDFTELLKNNDKVYVIQTASNKFIEVDKENLKDFEGLEYIDEFYSNTENEKDDEEEPEL